MESGTTAPTAVQRWMVMGMREKLIEVLMSRKYGFCSYDQMADYLLDNDVVPVVRCKDCKHCKKYRNRLDPMRNHQLCVRMDKYAFGVEEDDFCSYGERKDNDST